MTTTRAFVHEHLDQLPVANPDVIFRAVADGAVLLSAADEVYYGLNDVGARIWELLPPVSKSMAELCDTLAREYAVDPEMLRADVTELLADLARNGLVAARPAGGAA